MVGVYTRFIRFLPETRQLQGASNSTGPTLTSGVLLWRIKSQITYLGVDELPNLHNICQYIIYIYTNLLTSSYTLFSG